MKNLPVVFVLMAFISCKQGPVDLSTEKQNIQKAWTEWGAKAMAGDPSYGFTDSVIYMLHNQPQIKGKAAFNTFYKGMPAVPGMKIQWHGPHIIKMSAEANLAYSLDTLELMIPDSLGGIQHQFSHGVHIWEKDNTGAWKVSLLMIQPITPPQPQPQPQP